MPTMEEIYQYHADRYEALVSAEDIENNLGRLLLEQAVWQDAIVIEAGLGTGRVTKLYIEQATAVYGYDRSQHMLDFASQELSAHQQKLTLAQAVNQDLPDLAQPADIFIEGWSFGHTAVDCLDTHQLEQATCSLVTNATKNLKPTGTAIFIETQGTNTAVPAPPHPHLAQFYALLEREHRFTPHTIRTDYSFPSNEVASQVMGFFFGEGMAQAVQARGTAIIPEWTGVWVKKMG